jgi:LacI family transcriptional regulator
MTKGLASRQTTGQRSGMPLKGPVSMRAIAEAAGVSVSAVSLAMRNSSKISNKRRDAIMRIAEKLGYRPDPRVSELMEHLRTTRIHRAPSHVAVLIPELTREQLQHYPPIQSLLAGVREISGVTGFAVEQFFLADEGMSTRRIRSILQTRGIRGLIVAPFASGVAKLDFNFEGFCAATAGYSIVEPRLHRACPNYLQMMDELLATCVALGYRRVGLVMTYGEGGLGHKLFTSSFLYYQSKIAVSDCIPVLPKPALTVDNLRTWVNDHSPDVVIGSGPVYGMLHDIGLHMPGDIGFASIDISEPPLDAAGADHRYELVGREVFNLVLGALNLNMSGEPENPKVVLVDSHQRAGFTLAPKHQRMTRRRPRARRKPEKPGPLFHGFLT